MRYDFLTELKARINEINRKIETSKFLQNAVKTTNETLYNIHKRSLPINIDRIVMFNLEKEEAEKMLLDRFKTKVIQHRDEDLKTVIYYDVVPSEASTIEKSVFYNAKADVYEKN